MPSFKGFSDAKKGLTPLPGSFFSELLPMITDLAELKTILYTIWRLNQMEGAFRAMRTSDYQQDERFIAGLGDAPLDQALDLAVADEVLLGVSYRQEMVYFLNSPKGRAAAQALERGQWQPDFDRQAPLEWLTETPNIYKLYEEHIGPLSPLMAEALRDSENTYPASWIADAIRIAVENNKRNWRYINAILTRWQREGRNERQDRRDSEKDRRRYLEGEFSEFIDKP